MQHLSQRNSLRSPYIRVQIAAAVAVASLIAISQASYGASIATNAITDTNPSASNPYTNGQVVDPNVSFSGIGRSTVGTLSASSATGRYSASGWATTSTVNLNDYYSFTFTPIAGDSYSFQDFQSTIQHSGTGPTNFTFRSSLDGYMADLGTTTLATSNTAATTYPTISLSAVVFQNLTTAVTFRMYGYGGSSSGGTFSVNDFTFDGSTTSTSAAYNYFDVNGATAGSGVTNSGTYTFSGNHFNSVADGTGTTGAFTSGQTATFSAGTDAAGLSYTVNIDTAVSTNGLAFEEGNVTLANATGGSLTLVGSGVDVASGATATISQAVGGTVGLNKTDSGTLTLSNSGNSYTGGTTVSGGKLSIGADGDLGDASGGLLVNGGTLETTASITSARALAIGSSGATFATDGNTAAFSTSFTAGSSSTTAGYGLTEIGTGTLALTQTASSGPYIGAISVDTGGTILLHGNGAASPSYVTSFGISTDNGNLQAGTASTDAVQLELSGTGSVSGTGTITIDPNSRLISYGATTTSASNNTVNTSVTLVSDGTNVPVIGAGKFGALAVTGNITGSSGLSIGATATSFSSSASLLGKTTFSGTNSYSGDTTIKSGVLIVNGSNTGAGTVIVNAPYSVGTGSSAGTVNPTLAGNGSITGAVTVNGAISAGSGATASDTAGKLTTGGQTWAAGGEYAAKFANTAGGTPTGQTAGGGTSTEVAGGTASTWDTVSMSTLNVTGAFTVALIDNTASSFTFANGSAYAIATFTTALTSMQESSFLGLLTLDVSGLGLSNTTSGLSLDFNDAGTALDVVGDGEQSSPEPGTVALAGLAGAAFLGRRRRAGQTGPSLFAQLRRQFAGACFH